jgi:transposase-like protein
MEDGMDREELKRLTKEEKGQRTREGVKAVIEQVLEEEMTEHLAAGYRERTPSRRGERNGYYTRDLITPAGRIAQLRVPRDREAHVPQSERGVVAEELQKVFVARRRGTAGSLARGFVERYRDRYRRAVEVFTQGLAAFPSGKHGEEALTYLDFPGVHQRHIKSTNVQERLIREVKRRTRVVGVFPGEGSLVNLATVVMLRTTEDWAFRRYLDMGPLWAAEEKPTKIAT